MALTGLAIAAAIGLAKSELVDRPKEQRQRKLAGETQRLSPWTGLQAGQIQEADPIGTAMQFGATGAMMGQGYEASKLNEAAANRLNTGGALDGYGKNLYNYQPGGGGGQSYLGQNYNQNPQDFWGLKKSPWG